MDASILIALTALAGSIFSTLVSVYAGPAIQARRDSRRKLERYRQPLLTAAYELQARLHNILANGFIATYVDGDKAGKRDAALQSTLYVFAQFFAWREIIHRDVQFLHFPGDGETRAIAGLLQRIGDAFLTDELGPQFMIWRAEQRGLGERMIVATANGQACMGYASFVAQRRVMEPWLAPITRDLERIDANGWRRLTTLQHLLLDLVVKLDPDRTRYPYALERA